MLCQCCHSCRDGPSGSPSCADRLNAYSLDWVVDGKVKQTFKFTGGQPTYKFSLGELLPRSWHKNIPYGSLAQCNITPMDPKRVPVRPIVEGTAVEAPLCVLALSLNTILMHDALLHAPYMGPEALKHFCQGRYTGQTAQPVVVPLHSVWHHRASTSRSQPEQSKPAELGGSMNKPPVKSC